MTILCTILLIVILDLRLYPESTIQHLLMNQLLSVRIDHIDVEIILGILVFVAIL
jgi:hypothetical protein